MKINNFQGNIRPTDISAEKEPLLMGSTDCEMKIQIDTILGFNIRIQYKLNSIITGPMAYH